MLMGDVAEARTNSSALVSTEGSAIVGRALNPKFPAHRSMQTTSLLSAVVALSVASFAACGGTPAAPFPLVPLPSDAGVDAVSPALDADVAETDVADTEAAPGPDLHTIWNKTFGPSSDFQYEGAVRLAGAANGDIVVAGVYSGEALDFGGGPLTTTKKLSQNPNRTVRRYQISAQQSWS